MRFSLVVLLLASALLGGGIAHIGLPSSLEPTGLSLLETRFSDWLFYWRDRLYPGAVKIDPRLLLVGLDDETVQLLDKPDVFWDHDLAGVTQALLQGGAQAVGIDFVRGIPLGHAPVVIRDIVESYQNEMLECLSEDRTVIIELVSNASRKRWPERLVNAAAGGRNSCQANLLTDVDGTIRRMPFAISVGEGPPTAGAFSARLAELTVGQEMVSPAKGKWVFQSAPLLLSRRTLRINYPGAAGSFPKVSLAVLLRQWQNHESFEQYKGKTVIIAPDFATDLHATPTMLDDNRQTLGAEIHMAALNTYLTGQYLENAPGAAWWSPVALLSALVCLAFATLRIGLASLVSLVAAALYYLSCVWLFTHRGWILPLAAPTLGGSLSAVVGLFGRFRHSEQARERARLILRQMISPQVADLVLHGQELPRMGGQRQQITVLFSDINQFTPTCERLQPEQVIEMLNDYFSEMVRIIHRHHGYVKQFVGDEIMVIFGAPEIYPDHARRAVACALEMLERLQALHEQNPDKPGFYSVKIGINTGSAVVGQVGSRERSEYAAVGDDVNLAARLESLTTSLGVSNLISPTSKDACGEIPPSWNWRSMGLQRFKGKSVEMEVWTLERQSP